MTKLDNGAMSGPGKPSPFPWPPQKALLICSALTAVCFLTHIFFLFLVSPLNVLPLSKQDAYLYGAIPLCFGAIFFALAVYNFIIIEERSVAHILLLLLALSFGSLSLQGLLGLALLYGKPWLEGG